MFKTNRFVLAFLALLLNACSDLDNSIPPAELTEYKESVFLKINWSQHLGGGTDLYHKIEPAILEGSIYTISAQGLLSKVSIETGDIEWQQNLNLKFYAGLAVTKEVIILVSNDGLLNAYKNQEKQALLWSNNVESEVNVQPVVQDGDVYVRLSNGQLNAYSLASGEKKWSVSRRVPKLSITGSSPPFISGEFILSGFDDGSLVSLERATGEINWEKKFSESKGRSAFDRMIDLDGGFVIKNNIIYASTFQGRLAAIQMDDGQELWSRPMSSVKQISSDDQAIYVSDQASNLWAIDRRTGAALWKQEALHHRQLTAMLIVDNDVIVADFEGISHWLDKQSGTLKGRVNMTEGKVLNTPIAYKNKVLFLDTSNQLTAVSVIR